VRCDPGGLAPAAAARVLICGVRPDA